MARNHRVTESDFHLIFPSNLTGACCYHRMGSPETHRKEPICAILSMEHTKRERNKNVNKGTKEHEPTCKRFHLVCNFFIKGHA